MHTLPQQLKNKLAETGLSPDIQIGELTATEPQATRGDPVTLYNIFLTAAGAGGALSVLLGKDGFLNALARVLEKYVEGRQAEIFIEKNNGDKIKIKGPVGEIKALLKQARDD